MPRSIREGDRLGEISRIAQNSSLFRFHAVPGDLFGYICKKLKASKDTHISRRPWTLIVPALDKEEEDQITWDASDQTSPQPFGAVTEALLDRVNDLKHDFFSTQEILYRYSRYYVVKG